MLNDNTPPKASATDKISGDQVLVRFREDGDRPPLYFIPAGYGDIRMFQNVASSLEDDQPVYGLQPPKAEQIDGVRNQSVQWLVSTYISEIKRVQPAGPYLLVGYSSGGLLAVETAQQLIRNGDTVDLLILLDPPLQNPWWINLPYLGVNRLCNLTHLTDTIRWTIIRRWNSVLLRCISDEGLCTHISILREHEAEQFPGRIIFFRPRRSWIRLVGRTRIGKSWHTIARDGLEVHRVPGAHNEMLRGRQGKIFAAVLKSCLKRKERVVPESRLQLATSCNVTHCAKTLYSASMKHGRIDEVFDWDEMERLHQRALISDPVDMARSGAFVDAGLHENAAVFHRLLDTDG